MKLKGSDYLVVGDVTGYGKTLIELHKQAPTLKIVGLGDLIDRGPNSKLAMDYFIDNGFQSVMGNHDHFMWWEKHKNDTGVNPKLYPAECWGWNGGEATAKSFGFDNGLPIDIDKVPDKYWNFLESMPLKIDIDKYVLTHAPIGQRTKKFFSFDDINKDTDILDTSALWNRLGPYPEGYEDKIQLYGHNSPKGVLWHTNKHMNGIYRDAVDTTDMPWSICLDTWRNGYLTGLDLTNLIVYKQPIID